MVDARVVADALLWAADARETAGQTFNVDNGDMTDWRMMWPEIAKALNVEVGISDRPMSLSQYLTNESSLWTFIASKKALLEPDLAQLLGQSHHYADIILGFGMERAPPPLFLNTIKIRQAGFHGCMDSLDTMLFWIEDLRRRRYVA